MRLPASRFRNRARTFALSCTPLAAAFLLAGCGGIPGNQSLDSVHQPVVERAQYQIDLVSGPEGLSPNEQGRLADWFGALDLHYGDRIAIDDPLASPGSRAAVERAASRYGLLVGRDLPVGSTAANAGTVRVVVTRSVAYVPHCPDWSAQSESNPANATSSNYGCAVNSNLAAMVASPDDLLHGAHGNGVSSTMLNDKAYNAYVARAPSGTGDLKQNSTK